MRPGGRVPAAASRRRGGDPAARRMPADQRCVVSTRGPGGDVVPGPRARTRRHQEEKPARAGDRGQRPRRIGQLRQAPDLISRTASAPPPASRQFSRCLRDLKRIQDSPGHQLCHATLRSCRPAKRLERYQRIRNGSRAQALRRRSCRQRQIEDGLADSCSFGTDSLVSARERPAGPERSVTRVPERPSGALDTAFHRRYRAAGIADPLGEFALGVARRRTCHGQLASQFAAQPTDGIWLRRLRHLRPCAACDSYELASVTPLPACRVRTR